MDLKWLLVRRITLVALACFAAGAAIAMHRQAVQARQQNAALSELVGRQLDLQLSRIGRSTDIPQRFPDWDIVTTLLLQPGQCVEWRNAAGTSQRLNCAGVNSVVTPPPPQWFLVAYRSLINSMLSASRAVTFRGVSYGTVIAEFDAAATAGQAWATIAPLLGFAAALVAVLCLVTYFVINRALLPTQAILDGLNRLARGDLTYRLPRFRLSELNRISEVFNALSDDLNKATDDRADLARRLVDAQEQERRHIARELHDEIAQKLSALGAHAACLRTRAQRESPNLVDDSQELERMASALLQTLRRTLTYLRPQEIDDLGLIQSLEALVAQHNESAHGRTRFSMTATQKMQHLRSETSAHVYRIIQEALTNASRHANARNVEVLLSQSDGRPQETICLRVVDDGIGTPATECSSPPSGAGLIGMRERVVALNGKFVAGPLPSGGFKLEVEFPTLQRSP